MKKVPKKDFEDYKKWCKYYLNKFGLNDWTVYFSHDHCDGSLAQCRSNLITRGVTFALSSEIDKRDYDQIDVKSTARHEVCHLLVADLSQLIGSYCTKDEHDKADEELVCRLTNLLED